MSGEGGAASAGTQLPCGSGVLWGGGGPSRRCIILPQIVAKLPSLFTPHCLVVDLLLCRFDFGEAGRLLYDFVWSDFADW